MSGFRGGGGTWTPATAAARASVARRWRPSTIARWDPGGVGPGRGRKMGPRRNHFGIANAKRPPKKVCEVTPASDLKKTAVGGIKGKSTSSPGSHATGRPGPGRVGALVPVHNVGVVRTPQDGHRGPNQPPNSIQPTGARKTHGEKRVKIIMILYDMY